MSALDDLEKYRQAKKNKFQKVADKAEEVAKGKDFSSNDDERFWRPTVGSDGNGFAIVRFLPERPEEDFPWVSYWSHGFKGPTGKWYIEKCRTTLSRQSDPVADYNNKLWATELKSNQDQARRQKRRLHYISNILVVKDPAHPENEGKVFLYRYGKKIFDKINSLMNPEFDGEEREDPFDLEEGRNLKLKIKTVTSGPNKFPNYDDSEWMTASKVSDTDEGLAEILTKVYALTEFTDPKGFKAYDELKRRLDDVMGFDTQNDVDDMTKVDVMPINETPKTTESAESVKLDDSSESTDTDDNDEDALMKRLEALAKE